MKNVDVANLRQVAKEYLACLAQHSDVILTVLLQYVAVTKHDILLFVPRQEILSLRMYVVKPIVTFIWHGTNKF
jgi:hypothetical protein